MVENVTVFERRQKAPPPKPPRPIEADYPLGVPLGLIGNTPILVRSADLKEGATDSDARAFGFSGVEAMVQTVVGRWVALHAASSGGRLLLVLPPRVGALVAAVEVEVVSDPELAWNGRRHWRAVVARFVRTDQLGPVVPISEADLSPRPETPSKPDLFPGLRRPAAVPKPGERAVLRTGIDFHTGERWYEMQVTTEPKGKSADVAAAYALAHLINDRVGRLSSDGLMDELVVVYSDLNEAVGRSGPVDPTMFGLQGEHIERDYMAEAIRASIMDPNYLKTVAPRTGAAIRAGVNPNPALSHIIQFN